MEHVTDLIFTKRPSAFFSLYQAIRNGKHRIRTSRPIHPVHGRWDGIVVDSKGVERFCTLCGISSREETPFLYPLTLIYPFKLGMISSRYVPVPMFRMLTIRNRATRYQAIRPGDVLTLTGTISGQRFTGKGMEFDLEAFIRSDAGPVYHTVSTLFIPGFSGEKDPSYEAPQIEGISGAPEAGRWFLPSGRGFKFSKIIGDSNGIHYNKTYARMLGYKRDFAQPVMVASQCLERLPDLEGNGPVRLELYFKGPVYYDSELTLTLHEDESGQRFDLYCEGNDRPCICGKRSVLMQAMDTP